MQSTTESGTNVTSVTTKQLKGQGFYILVPDEGPRESTRHYNPDTARQPLQSQLSPDLQSE